MSVAARKPAPKPSSVGARPTSTWSVVQPASGTIAAKPIASAAAKNTPPWASAPSSLGLNARRCARSPVDHRRVEKRRAFAPNLGVYVTHFASTACVAHEVRTASCATS